MILGEHKFVNGIHTFLNLGERQGVVVVKDNVVSRGRNLDEGECRGFCAGLLPYIRNLGSVELNRDRPDVSGTVTFSDGDKLTLNNASLSAVGGNVQSNVVVDVYLERQFLSRTKDYWSGWTSERR